jgi:hypothetical protein
MSENSALRYVHQDTLSSTSLMTDSSGSQIDTAIRYYTYAGCFKRIIKEPVRNWKHGVLSG